MPEIFNSTSTPQTPPVVQPVNEPQATHAQTVQTQKPSPLTTPPVGIPITHMNLFSTLTLSPDGVTFANQEPDEDIVLFFRSDFIINVPWIASTIVLFFIPPLLALLLPLTGFSLVFFTPQITIVITTFFYILVLGYAFISFMYWFYNVGIASKKHVVDIDFADVTYKNIATSTMGEVSDIDYTQQGFFATFFDYGNIDIRTQGSTIAIEFSKVPQPGKIANIILQLRDQVAKNG